MAYKDTSGQDSMTRDRFNSIGAAVRNGIRLQNEAIEKQAQLHGVPASDIAMKLLEQRKGDMLKWLHDKGIEPISMNPATLATQIAGAIHQEVNQVKVISYDTYERECTYEDCFDEYMGGILQEEQANPYSPLHWSNNPEGALVSNADGDGGGDLAAANAVNGLSNVAESIPGIGSILGPIMKIGGSILGSIGKKKRRKAEAKKAEEDRKAAELEQMRLAQEKKMATGGKKKMLVAGGVVLVIVVLLIVSLTGKK